MGDFALAGTERVCVFWPPVYFLPGLQFPDIGVVLADGAVGGEEACHRGVYQHFLPHAALSL